MDDKLEKAAVNKLLHSFATCIDGELVYQRNAMLNMFRKGAQWQLANMWIPVEERVPEVGVPVFVLTKNESVSTSKMYIPKDCYGTILGDKEWRGSYAFRQSVIAWMPIPEFKKGE